MLQRCQITPVEDLPVFALSAGLAEGQLGDSVWDAAWRADQALYQAKQARKGRVIPIGDNPFSGK